MSRTARRPTVFHLTHGKSGSQWIYQILESLFPHRIVHPQSGSDHFHALPIRQGGIYPTVYTTRSEFESVKVPAHHRKFFVMRDLRDTLVSLYFSLKYSHASDPIGMVAHYRDQLNSMGEEEGMELLFPVSLDHIVETQLSWMGGDVPVFRYEDALKNPMEFYGAILDHCELKVSHAMLRNAVDAMSFKSRTGRAPGVEDRSSHYRRGVAGDWRNHLKGALLEKFLARFAGVLVKTGYETQDSFPQPHGALECPPTSLNSPPSVLGQAEADMRARRLADFATLHRQWNQEHTARPETTLQQDALVTGTGWYPVEEFEDQRFCWVADEAELTVQRPSGRLKHLQLELEPGPSVQSLPTTLSILDRSGQSLATVAMVAGRQRITLDLSACMEDAGEDWELIFKVEDAGAAMAGDPRTLSYRVFRFGWAYAAQSRQDAWGMEVVA